MSGLLGTMVSSGMMSDTLAPAKDKRHILPSDRRSEPRVPATGTGKLTVMGPRRLENLDADVLDVSRRGMQLEVGAFLESGSVIELRLRTLSVSCEVAHSRLVGLGRYRVGVITGYVTALRQEQSVDELALVRFVRAQARLTPATP